MTRYSSTLAAGLLLSLCQAPSLPAAGSSNGWLLVANQGDRDLSIVDPSAAKQVSTVPEGGITDMK